MDDDDVSRKCRIVSNAICTGTEQDPNDFHYLAAFAVNIAGVVAERNRLFSDLEAETIPTITGSVSEFYIEPMLSCVEDYDIMHHFSHEVALPYGYRVPDFLSYDFSEPLQVYEMHESRSGIANYVCLVAKEETLSVRQIGFALEVMTRAACLSNCVYERMHQTHGPALVQDILELQNNHGLYFKSHISSDFVRCMRCPVWPPQAGNWSLRSSDSCWPGSVIIDRVVSLGCDVVPVSHSCHKDDSSQWRLSFSRAEVVLLNSWTPLQQIVYHMLRFFVKTNRLTKHGKQGNGSNHGSNFSMYHVKTLMLWACEAKPPAWWSNSSNAIQMCRELLNRLGWFLFDGRCAHYFVDNCNLLQYFRTEDQDIRNGIHQLMFMQDFELVEWFTHRYLKTGAIYNCLSEIRQSLDKVRTSAELDNALSAMTTCRGESFRMRSLGRLESAASDASTFLSAQFTERSCKVYVTERAKLGQLYRAFVAFVFLVCSGKLQSGRCLYNRILHILTAVNWCCTTLEKTMFKPGGTMTVATVNDLMTRCRHPLLTEPYSFPQIDIELTKALLHLVLRRNGRQANPVSDRVNVYLAVLHYITGHYDNAVAFCRLTIARNSLSLSEKEPSILKVEGHLLTDHSSDVTAVGGIACFYQYLQRKLTDQHATYSTNVYSGDALVRFVAVKCHQSAATSAVGHFKLHEEMRRYRKCIRTSSTKLFLGDILLFRLVSAECPAPRVTPVFRWRDHLQRPRNSAVLTADYDPSELSEILVASAVRLLTSFRESEADRFGSDCVTSTTDFEALYAYRRGQYDKCLSLSGELVSRVLHMQVMPIVCVDSVQLALMDDDIASILGLLQLTGKPPVTQVRIATQLTIGLYLEIQCLLKKKNSVPLIDRLLKTMIAFHRHGDGQSLSHWILAYIYRKARLYLNSFRNTRSTGSGTSAHSLRDGESIVSARVLPWAGCTVLQVRTITKTVSYSIEPIRLLI